MTVLARSTLVWAAAFFALELPAILWKRCPWLTFSDMVRGSIQWWHVLAAWITVLFVILYGHFEDGWRARYLIAWAVVTAAGVIVHLLIR